MKFFIVAAVGLILAVAEIHCKSVSSEPGCETEVLLDCTKRLDYLNSDKALELGASQQDLENVCPTLQDGMQCINDYSNRCLPENIQAYFQSMYNGTMLVITELCRPGDFQSEYLKHAPCMDKAKTEYKQCVDDYNRVMVGVNPAEKDMRTNNIKVMCCSFSEYISCSNKLVRKRCGDDTAKFTKNLLDRLASPIIQEHCHRHFNGEKECSGIMSSLETANQHSGSDHQHHHHALDSEVPEPVPEPESKSSNPLHGDVSSANDIDRNSIESGASAESSPSLNAASGLSSAAVLAILSPAAVFFLLL